MPVQSPLLNTQTSAVKASHRPSPALWLILAVVAALAIAYQPVIFNFFTSDDFYIISWLHSLQHQPLRLFQGVYEGTPYYRPFTNAFWFCEYLVCNTDSVLYRLISIGIEFLSAIVLGFILTELSTVNKTKIANSEWPFFAAGLFLLWPLHTEPIN
jgi:hypothetical protein